MLQEIHMMTFKPRSGWIGFGRPTLQAAKKATGENINILHFFLQILHHVEFSRHEKSVKCYNLYRFFVIFLHSINIPSYPTKHGPHNVCEHRIFELGGFQLWIQ